ncbi:MAG: hypothetical protein ACI4C5_08625, partial [Lachnospiraceae bacterium]
MKKAKGITKRLTALFLAVTFLTGTLSAGMNVEAAGKKKTVYGFYDRYRKNTYDFTNDDWKFAMIDFSNSQVYELRGDVYSLFVGGSMGTSGNDLSGLIYPKIYNNDKWVSVDPSQFDGYRLRVTPACSDKGGRYSWNTMKKPTHNFKITIRDPKGKEIYVFTQNDFNSDGYCKKTIDLPIKKGMTFYRTPDPYMYSYSYEAFSESGKNNQKFPMTHICFLPNNEKKFVQYMANKTD